MPSGEAALKPENPNEEALWTAFQKFDVDGDGQIHCAEFTRLMKSLGSFSSTEISRLFKEADVDQSGGVDWREFIKWISSGNATNGTSAVAAESFQRMLMYEHQDEASFVEQANASKHLRSVLKESDIREAEDSAQAQRNLAKTKKAMQAPASDGTTSWTTGSMVATKSMMPAAPMQGSDLGIGENYHGFRLTLPMTLEGATALMRHYLVAGDSEPIHPKYVAYLTTTFTHLYLQRHPKPVVKTDIPKPGRMVVVGDTHGQLADVIHIMHSMGTPSPQNKYLFNGDMCDRGTYSVEILLILFAFFIADPECIIIHRGNHENEDMNAMHADGGGGFADEVARKYGLMAYRRFVSAMKSMSLCSVIQKEVFVVHGGLSRVSALSIDYIDSIKHSLVTTPHPNASETKDQVFSDLVWSDPTEHPGKFKSDRGVGIKFGPDMTEKFCKINKIRFMIRSHQVPEDGRGFMKMHQGRCVTIFSASNYCGEGQNYGAVLVLDSQTFPKYEVVEHYASPLEEMPPLLGMGLGDTQLSSKESKAKQEAASTKRRLEKELERMIISIIEKKPALWAHLVNMALGNALSIKAWEDVMSEIVEGSNPWAEAAKHWGIVESTGATRTKKVHMDKFLRRWVVTLESEQYTSFLNDATKKVYEAMLRRDMDLQETLKLFDQDGDGSVDLKEVREVLTMFDLGLTATQLDRLTGQIFSQVCCLSSNAETEADGSTRINVQDFLGNFMVIYNANSSAAEGGKLKLEKWMQSALNMIGHLITTLPADKLVSEMDQAAVKIQKVFRGRSARKEVDVLMKTGSTPMGRRKSWSLSVFSKQEKQEPPSSAASRATSAAASKESPAASKDPVDLACTMSATLGATWVNKLEPHSKMLALFAAMDNSCDGILQIDEFVNGIEKVPGVTDLMVEGKPLSHERLMALAHGMDGAGNSNGTINYMEFLQAFETSGEGNQLFAETLGEDITTVLFRHRLAIRMGCQYMDPEGTGRVLASDFDKVLHGVNSVLSGGERMLTNVQISLLVGALKCPDKESGLDLVDYDAFLRSFVILDTARDRAVVKRF